MTVFRKIAADTGTTEAAEPAGLVDPQGRRRVLSSLTFEMMLHGKLDEAVLFAAHKGTDLADPAWVAKYALFDALLAAEAVEA